MDKLFGPKSMLFLKNIKNVKNNFSKLTNLDKLFNFEEEYARWNKRISDSKKQTNELSNREIIIKSELEKLEKRPNEIAQNKKEIDSKIIVLEFERKAKEARESGAQFKTMYKNYNSYQRKKKKKTVWRYK